MYDVIVSVVLVVWGMVETVTAVCVDVVGEVVTVVDFDVLVRVLVTMFVVVAFITLYVSVRLVLEELTVLAVAEMV
jgi:hypothetical protein